MILHIQYLQGKTAFANLNLSNLMLIFDISLSHSDLMCVCFQNCICLNILTLHREAAKILPTTDWQLRSLIKFNQYKDCFPDIFYFYNVSRLIVIKRPIQDTLNWILCNCFYLLIYIAQLFRSLFGEKARLIFDSGFLFSITFLCIIQQTKI